MICDALLTILFRRVIETLHEVSEVALLTLGTDGMRLQVTDTLCLCTLCFHVKASRITDYPSLTKARTLIIDLGQWQAILKQEHCTVFHLRLDDAQQLWMGTSTVDQTQVEILRDQGTWPRLSHKLYQNWPVISHHPQEFAYEILDLSVGGGVVKLVFSPITQQLQLTTAFETGVITSVTPALMVTGAQQMVVSGTFVLKFLKLLCGIMIYAVDLTLHFQQQTPLVILMYFDRDTQLHIAIAPEKET